MNPQSPISMLHCGGSISESMFVVYTSSSNLEILLSWTSHVLSVWQLRWREALERWPRKTPLTKYDTCVTLGCQKTMSVALVALTAVKFLWFRYGCHASCITNLHKASKGRAVSLIRAFAPMQQEFSQGYRDIGMDCGVFYAGHTWSRRWLPRDEHCKRTQGWPRGENVLPC